MMHHVFGIRQQAFTTALIHPGKENSKGMISMICNQFNAIIGDTKVAVIK
jgi:hypothetical protein